MKLISRQEAREQGAFRYYTGKPCCRGHVTDRLVSNFACVACHKQKVARYNKANPNKRKLYLKEWNRNNPECSQRWAKRNPDKYKILKKARTARWRQHNRERYACSWRNYHARKKAAAGRHTGDDILILLERQKGRCAGPHCKQRLGAYHVDHKTPLSRKGSNWPRNLQLLCASCNGSKGAKTQREWYRCLGI